MTDALEFVRQQADIIEAFGSDDSIVFRIDGAPEAWLVDRTGTFDAEPSAWQPQIASVGPAPIAFPQDPPSTVVGEDTSGDGNIDQRDAKRALILAPYLWQFAPWDESDHLAKLFGTLPGYAGNVEFAANRKKGDQNVTFDHLLSLANYDTVFFSTHGKRECESAADGKEVCHVQVSTGVTVNVLDIPASGVLKGLALIGAYDNQSDQASVVVELGLTPDFFRYSYPRGLDNTLLVLSACKTGGQSGNELARAVGGENFVMMAWSETVRSSAAFKASGLFAEQLGLGLSSKEAYKAVVDAGLHRAINRKGIETVFQHISPADDDIRIIELPTLQRDGRPMEDGVNVSDGVTGTPGDDQPDQLKLEVRVAGVHERGSYTVRYEIDGKPTRGLYDLSNAKPGDLEFSYLVEHDIDVGFDLPAVGFTIEAIVDLPEGGESRYYVSATLDVRCDASPLPLPPGSQLITLGEEGVGWGEATCLFSVPSYDEAVAFIRRELPEAGYPLVGETSPRVLYNDNRRSIGWVIPEGPGLCGMVVLGLIDHPEGTAMDLTVLASCAED